MDPKVSVIIATHNHAHFLPECLGSVKAQTYKDYEVIVVDNGSTDDTKNVIKDLAWDKLVYYYQNDTGSVAGPRNTGIRLAKGKYVAFLDSDDIWYEQKLLKIMDIIEKNPDIDLITHDIRIVSYGKPEKVVRVGPRKKADSIFKELLFCGNFIAGSATVVKRSMMEKIGGFDTDKNYVHAEDYETWLRIASISNKFFFLNECLGDYRVHKSNLSHDFETAFLNEICIVKKHYGMIGSKSLRERISFRIRIARCYVEISLRFISVKRDSLKALKYVILAFSNDPLILPEVFIRAIRRTYRSLNERFYPFHSKITRDDIEYMAEKISEIHNAKS